MVIIDAVRPAFGFPRAPRPPAGGAAGAAPSAAAAATGAIGVLSTSILCLMKTLSASASDATAERKNGELSNRSLFGIDVEWNCPLNVLYGSAPRVSRMSMRSRDVSLFG